MKKTDSLNDYDVIVPSSTKKVQKRVKTNDINKTIKPKKSSKENIMEEEDVVFDKPKRTTKKVETEVKKTTRTRKPAKTNIIEEEDVVFSRTKKNSDNYEVLDTYSRTQSSNYRKRDRKLESLIEEINKDHRQMVDDEILDLPPKTKKVVKKPIIEEDDEVIKSPKDDEKTIVINKIDKKKVFNN